MSQRTVSSVREENKEVKQMSEKERADIIDALKELPEADKQFMLGYAAGRSASQPEQNEKEKEEAPADG